MIRKAEATDKSALAELYYIILEELEIEHVRKIEKSRLIDVLEQSIVDVNYRGHYSHARVDEIDGEVAGCLVAYPGKDERRLEDAWMQIDMDDDIRELGQPMPLEEANDDEWYIETVATFPEYRGRGVATGLIKHVVNEHPEYKWSLNCDEENTNALRLYKKLGFERESDIDLYGHLHHHMLLK
ncbi:ribosomal protein S18 acetylase RimI-like enzyme [Staphylococcus auricularis]|uniref:GNAT family N-acetyltransferase n=1 Tax=Staphylococcus auricularis TaxID=29379 RepID=UPI00193240C5|nr:GNAT family N-acetyltransferase [Staphylococcus auricularis]MBM0868838.1 GNAT family N-acetyltransferase [Staphylococcus auricularis]